MGEFLGLLTEDKRNKIPEEIRGLFKEEKDKVYVNVCKKHNRGGRYLKPKKENFNLSKKIIINLVSS